MKPVIGVILRKSLSETNKNILVGYTDIHRAIISSGGIPIGIDATNIDMYIDICKGFILQGGDDIDNDNILCLKKLKDIDIPVLGICLGMQEMAYLEGGILYDIKGHKDTKHEVIIDRESLLYKIIGSNRIMVNSRHKSGVLNPKINICARALDGVIEAISDNNKMFYLGLQWHPENMDNIDTKKIFDYFIKICDDN